MAPHTLDSRMEIVTLVVVKSSRTHDQDTHWLEHPGVKGWNKIYLYVMLVSVMVRQLVTQMLHNHHSPESFCLERASKQDCTGNNEVHEPYASCTRTSGAICPSCSPSTCLALPLHWYGGTKGFGLYGHFTWTNCIHDLGKNIRTSEYM